MRTWKKFLPSIILLLFGSASFAQEQASEVDMRIKEAEIRMEEAVRQIAELSASQMASVANVERRLRIDGRPVLGVNVGNDENGPVEGVDILGVSPGGAAADAGLRAGDVITAINGEPLTGESGQAATAKLLEFMAGVEEGDVLDVEYLRNGKVSEVELTPAAPSGYKFAFRLDSDDFHLPVDPAAPGAFVNEFIWMSGSHGWGDMEIVELSERLGSYFGTATGLLVVKAPGNGDFKLQDGDVIRSIDGREPTSVRHAMRILGSYQSGEALKIEIMRDRRKETLNIEVPDNRQSSVTELSPGSGVHRMVIKRTDDQT